MLRECNTIALIWASMPSTINVSSEKMLRFLTFHSCQHVIRTPIFQEVDQLSPERMDMIQGIIRVWTKEAYKVGGRRCLQMAAAVRQLLKTWSRSSSAWVQIEHVWSAVKWRLCLSLLVRSFSLRSSHAKERILYVIGSFHTKLHWICFYVV